LHLLDLAEAEAARRAATGSGDGGGGGGGGVAATAGDAAGEAEGGAEGGGGGAVGGRGRRPFAFVVSGGGFRTMTAGMAFARALSIAFDEATKAAEEEAEAGAERPGGRQWDDVTHIGGNSGGQWFAVPFAFSRSFYRSLTARNDSLAAEA